MKTIILDYSTIWKSLPWSQIEEKIFILQQKIYESSKECNQKEVQKLQNYILNSSDSKIFVIQKVVDYISKYYIKYNKEKYNFNDEDKFLVYKSLFENKICSNEVQFVIEQIKQYLVYLCIKPEWEARFEPIYKFNVNSKKQYYFLYRLSKFLLKNLKYQSQKIDIYPLKSQLISKYTDLKYLICKIHAIPSISYYLQYWLNNQYILETLNNNRLVEKWTDYTISNFHQLIYRIMCNGIDWYNTNYFQNIAAFYSFIKYLDVFIDTNNSIWICVKNTLLMRAYIYNINQVYYAIGVKNILLNTDNIYKNKQKILVSEYLINYSEINHIFLFHDYDNSIIQIDKNIYKYFVRQVRDILYHQNFLGKWRSNGSLNLIKLLKKIKEKFLDFSLYYYPLINLENVNFLITLIDDLIFRWIKKNNKALLQFHENQKKIHLYLLSNLMHKSFYN